MAKDFIVLISEIKADEEKMMLTFSEDILSQEYVKPVKAKPVKRRSNKIPSTRAAEWSAVAAFAAMSGDRYTAALAKAKIEKQHKRKASSSR